MPSRRLLIRPFQLLTPGGRRLPDISWITPALSVGGTLHPRHIGELARMGIGAIVDLREEARDDEGLLTQHDIRLLHLPVRDHGPPSQAQLLQGTRWVVDQLEAGGKVLIHCREGVGRSAVLACCVLMHQGESLTSALRLVKARRWGSHPRRRQREALEQFAQLGWSPGPAAPPDPPPHTQG